MSRLLAGVLVVLALVAAVSATPGTPGCFNNQVSFNWSYIEFHDINLQPLDVVLTNSDVAMNFETQQLMIEGDFIYNTTTYIGSIYINGSNLWVMIHGDCTYVSNNITGVFANQCVQNSTVARRSTMGNDTIYIFRESLEFPALNVVRRTYTYWTDVPVSQPVAWQSMFLNNTGDEVGTSSWIADGYQPTADPAKLAVPASCLNDDKKMPKYVDLRDAMRAEPHFRVVEALLMNLVL